MATTMIATTRSASRKRSTERARQPQIRRLKAHRLSDDWFRRCGTAEAMAHCQVALAIKRFAGKRQETGVHAQARPVPPRSRTAIPGQAVRPTFQRIAETLEDPPLGPGRGSH